MVALAAIAVVGISSALKRLRVKFAVVLHAVVSVHNKIFWSNKVSPVAIHSVISPGFASKQFGLKFCHKIVCQIKRDGVCLDDNHCEELE